MALAIALFAASCGEPEVPSSAPESSRPPDSIETVDGGDAASQLAAVVAQLPFVSTVDYGPVSAHQLNQMSDAVVYGTIVRVEPGKPVVETQTLGCADRAEATCDVRSEVATASIVLRVDDAASLKPTAEIARPELSFTIPLGSANSDSERRSVEAGLKSLQATAPDIQVVAFLRVDPDGPKLAHIAAWASPDESGDLTNLGAGVVGLDPATGGQIDGLGGIERFESVAQIVQQASA